MSSYEQFICLACGGDLPEPLRWTASLRCHDCRELDTPLRVEHALTQRTLRLRRSRELSGFDPSAEPTAA